MPFLPPNQQCQSTEGSGRPTKSQSHNSIALSCPAKIHTFHKSSTLKSASDVHRLAARLNSFYPRDAMLALVLAMALCLSVCHKSAYHWSGWTARAGFWHGDFIQPVIHCVLRKFSRTSLWYVFRNSGRRKFCHGTSHHGYRATLAEY